MAIKSFLAKPFASYIHKQIKKGMETAVQDQQAVFNNLIKAAAKTEFGKEHRFTDIKTYEGKGNPFILLKQAVPPVV